MPLPERGLVAGAVGSIPTRTPLKFHLLQWVAGFTSRSQISKKRRKTQISPSIFFPPCGNSGEQMPIEEQCEKCGSKMTIIVKSSTPDLIQYQANCPTCHTNFDAVLLPRQPAPVEPKNEDSSIQ